MGSKQYAYWGLMASDPAKCLGDKLEFQQLSVKQEREACWDKRGASDD